MRSSPNTVDYRSPIDDLAALRAFVAVVDTGSFAEAGRRLRVVPSTISKHVSSLEQRIAGQLIVRSTKRLHVSELGRRFYERCLTILHEVQAAEEEIGEYNAEPQGLLKLTAPTVFAAHHLSPILSSFLAKCPKVRLDLTVTTETLDMIEAGIDVAIRISSNLDPGLIALRLAANMRVYCASPTYIERHGAPQSVADLTNHNCVLSRGHSRNARWPMRQPDGGFVDIPVSGNFSADSGDLVRGALLDGVGIGYVARFLIQQDLTSGALVELFPDDRVITSHLYAVYVDRRNMPIKTRAFLDHLRDWYRATPDWAT
ncbi:MAG TPA: LysR family transcriptional regulator [Burkholderiales bacterium]